MSEWDRKDNPNVRGPKDSHWVALTEPYEVSAFVDHFLKSNNFGMTDANREVVKNSLKGYGGRSPVSRDDLTQFLLKMYGKTS
jgi:hypothetical protein